MSQDTALRLQDVHVRRGDRAALAGVTWSVRRDERWVVLGPNGCGKTTLLQLATGHLHPTSGSVDVLGLRLGRTDVRALRTRIGLVSGAVTRLLRPALTAAEVVVTGRHGALEPWWHTYGETDHERARALLEDAGLAAAAGRAFGVLSEGERQQVLLARALMSDPELLLLDEPAAGLDLGAREHLLQRMAAVASDPASPPIVFVTHHVEEIPPGFGSLLVLRDGGVVARGALGATLRDDVLTATYGLPIEVHADGGRFAARASAPLRRR